MNSEVNVWRAIQIAALTIRLHIRQLWCEQVR